MLFVKFVENMYEYSWIFASTGSYRDFLSRFEQLVIDYGLVYFWLESSEEAVLADRLLSFGSLDECFLNSAGLANELWHLLIYFFYME